MAPPGMRAVIYEDPKTRTSWGPRATDAWYCKPSFDHYRNYKFFVLETGAYHTFGLVEAMKNLPMNKKWILLQKMT